MQARGLRIFFFFGALGGLLGVAFFLHWGANFLVSQTFPILLDDLGPGPVFLGYAAVGVLAFVFVKALVPETKGRSLEEIEESLRGRDRTAATVGTR